MDTALDILLDNGRSINHHTGRIYGVVPAIVVSIKDEKQKRHEMGYIQVRFPWLQEENDPQSILPWARVVRPGTPEASGVISYPKVGDEVLVAFEQGDIHHPYVIGTLWNGVDRVKGPESPKPADPPPKRQQPAPTARSGGPCKGKNDTMIVRSSSGNMVILDDSAGTIMITDAGGQSLIEVKKGSIEIRQYSGDLNIWACKKVSIDCEDFIVKASNKIEMSADGTYDGKSKGNMSHATQAVMKQVSDGNMNVETKGNLSVKAASNIDVTAGGCIATKSGGDTTVTAGGCIATKSGGDTSITAGGSVSVKGASVDVNGAGTVKVIAGGSIVEQAPTIALN